jgi:hypothetical protein
LSFHHLAHTVYQFHHHIAFDGVGEHQVHVSLHRVGEG